MHLACQGHAPFPWNPVDVALLMDAGDEAMGSKTKEWLSESREATPWLLKLATDKNGYVRGEDWAECLAHVVAETLGVPSACIALANAEGRRGVLVRRVNRIEEALVHGNELLAAVVPDYDTQHGRKNSDYSLLKIQLSLQDYAGTADVPGDAFDTFTGFLVLDALIAGMDRHHENWAVIAGSGALAPSFDHGNAFGYNLREPDVETLLRDGSALDRWLLRGKAVHFVGRPSLVTLAADALLRAHRDARNHWRNRLENLSWDELHEAAARMPTELLSDVHRRLVLQMVELNRRRLLDALSAG